MTVQVASVGLTVEVSALYEAYVRIIIHISWLFSIRCLIQWNDYNL